MADEVAKKSGGGIMIPALIITLIAAGGGAAFGALVLGPGSGGGEQHAAAGKHGKKDKHAKNDKKGKKAKKGKSGSDDGKTEVATVSDTETIVTLPKIVANLNDSGKNWLRLEASIIAKPGTKPISPVTRRRLAQDIFAYIRQSRLEELEGAAGLINLRSDLSDVVRIRTRGRSEELVIHGMIVE